MTLPPDTQVAAQYEEIAGLAVARIFKTLTTLPGWDAVFWAPALTDRSRDQIHRAIRNSVILAMSAAVAVVAQATTPTEEELPNG